MNVSDSNVQSFIHTKMNVLEVVFQSIAICVLVRAIPSIFENNTQEDVTEDTGSLQVVEGQVSLEMKVTGSYQEEGNDF